jgi:hypothetical protein
VIWARLINLQLKEYIGIRAEARGQWHGGRQTVEPVAAGLLGRASITPMECGGVAQAQTRNNTAAPFYAEALHHFTDIDWQMLRHGRRSHDLDPLVRPPKLRCDNSLSRAMI